MSENSVTTFCTKCGSFRAEGTRFCTVCGAPFPEPAVPEPVTPVTGAAPLSATPPATPPTELVAEVPMAVDEPMPTGEPVAFDAPVPTGESTAFDASVPVENLVTAPEVAEPLGAEPAWAEPVGTEPAWGEPTGSQAGAGEQLAETRWDIPVVEAEPTATYIAPAGPAYAPPPYAPPPQMAPMQAPPQGPPVQGAPPGVWSGQPGQDRPGRRGRGRMPFVLAAAVVVLLAAGGGAYALVSSGHGKNSAQPPVRPTVNTKATQAAIATPTTAASTAPSPSLSPTPSPSPTTSPGAVAVPASLSANPDTAHVASLLNHYFAAINTRNYAEYSALLDSQMQSGNSASSFDSGYATTKDSAEKLVSLSGSGGDEAATVSFTSHQSATDSVNDSSCTNWTITLYLAPQGDGYVITEPPSSYHPAYANCP
jgi:hypothetical protein